MPTETPGSAPLSHENQALIARHFPRGIPAPETRELARQAVDRWFLGGKRSPRAGAGLAEHPELLAQWTRHGLSGVFRAAPKVLAGAPQPRVLGGPGT